MKTIEKPLDMWGNEITGKKSLNWGVILSFFFGFVGVLYADIRYGLYLGLIFLGCALLMGAGLACIVFNMFGLGVALALLGCVLYVAYRVVSVCLTVSITAEKNEKWLIYEYQLQQLCEKEE